jgi:hypothetical protein
MKEILKLLPKDGGAEKSNMRVGFITYDKVVHFYNIKVRDIRICENIFLSFQKGGKQLNSVVLVRERTVSSDRCLSTKLVPIFCG